MLNPYTTILLAFLITLWNLPGCTMFEETRKTIPQDSPTKDASGRLLEFFGQPNINWPFGPGFNPLIWNGIGIHWPEYTNSSVSIPLWQFLQYFYDFNYITPYIVIASLVLNIIILILVGIILKKIKEHEKGYEHDTHSSYGSYGNYDNYHYSWKPSVETLGWLTDRVYQAIDGADRLKGV